MRRISTKSVLARLSEASSSGSTSFQNQTDQLTGQFLEQATDWKSLAALMAGGLAYRLGKIGTISIGTGHVTAMPLRTLSVAFGLGSEVTAYEFTNRTLHTLMGEHIGSPLQNPSPVTRHPSRLWSFSGPGGWKQGWISSLITFGTLKGFGKLAEEQNLILQHASQDLGMVVGHQVLSYAGIGERPGGTLSEQLVHAETTNLQMSAGLALGHHLTDGRLLALDRGLDLVVTNSRAHGRAPLQGLPLAIMSAGTPSVIPVRATHVSPTHNIKINPNILLSTTYGNNSTMHHEDASHVGTSPPDQKQLPDLEAPTLRDPQFPPLPGPLPPGERVVIEVPQFTQHLSVDEKTLERMEAFPAKVKDQHEKGREPNPVYFGLNHLKWWMGLIQKHIGALGAEAIVLGGKILFGRFQEDSKSQEEVENDLKLLAHESKATLRIKSPQPESWWRPVWERAAGGAQGAGEFLAAILQQLPGDSFNREMADQWLMEIATQDFERSELIREKAAGDPIPLEGQVPPEFIYTLQDFHPLILKDDWTRVNEKLAELYQQALGFPNLSETIMGVLAIKETLYKNMAFKEDLEAIKLRKKKANPTVPIGVQNWKEMDSHPIQKGIGMRWEALLANLEFICDRRNNRGFTLGGEEGRLEALALAALAFVQKALNDPTVGAEALLKKARERATSYYQNREGSIRPSQGGLNRLLDEINSFETHSKWLGRSISWNVEVQKVLREAEEGNWSQAFKSLNQISDKFFQPIALALLAKMAKEKGALGTPEISPSYIPRSPAQIEGFHKLVKKISEEEKKFIWTENFREQTYAALGFVLKRLGQDLEAEKFFERAKTLVAEQTTRWPNQVIEQYLKNQFPNFDPHRGLELKKAQAEFLSGNWEEALKILGAKDDPYWQAFGLADLARFFPGNENQSPPLPKEGTETTALPRELDKEMVHWKVDKIHEAKSTSAVQYDWANQATLLAALGFALKQIGRDPAAEKLFDQARQVVDEESYERPRGHDTHYSDSYEEIEKLKNGMWPGLYVESIPGIQAAEADVRAGNWDRAFPWIDHLRDPLSQALSLAYLIHKAHGSQRPKEIVPDTQQLSSVALAGRAPFTELQSRMQQFMNEAFEEFHNYPGMDTEGSLIDILISRGYIEVLLKGDVLAGEQYWKLADEMISGIDLKKGPPFPSLQKDLRETLEKCKGGHCPFNYTKRNWEIEEWVRRGEIEKVLESIEKNHISPLAKMEDLAWLVKVAKDEGKLERLKFSSQGIPQKELSFDEVVKQYLVTIPEEEGQKTESVSSKKVNLPQETIEAFERILKPDSSTWSKKKKLAQSINLNDLALISAVQGFTYHRLGNQLMAQERFEGADRFGGVDSKLREEIESLKNDTWSIDIHSISHLKEAEEHLKSNNLKAALALLPSASDDDIQGWIKKSLFLAHLIKVLTEETHLAKSPPVAFHQNTNQAFNDFYNLESDPITHFFQQEMDSIVDLIAIEKERGKSSWQELALVEVALGKFFQTTGNKYLAKESYDLAENYIQEGRSQGENLNSFQKGIFEKIKTESWSLLPKNDARLRNEFQKNNFPALSALIAAEPHLLLKASYLIYLSSLWADSNLNIQTQEPNSPTTVAHDPIQKLPLFPQESKSNFDHLPLRDIDSIPEEYWHLIPQPKNKVLFDRFQRILNETAFLINAPDRIAIRLFGPPGTAKTTIPEMIAAKMQLPLLRFPFSKRTDPSDLEGLWTREEVDGQIVPVFKEGAPTVAMEHGFHLVLDEPDLARPGVLAYINNISAPGEFAWVRKKNGNLEKIKVHEDYHIWATENGVQQVAREEHGKDFLRRFVPYHVGAWTKDEITAVLAELYENFGGRNRWNRKTSEILALFHDKMATLAKGMQDAQTKVTLTPLGSGVGQQLEFTPRSILRVAQRLIASGAITPESLSRAIRAEYILPLADKQDRELVWGQAQAIFRPLAQEKGWSPDAIGAKSIPVPTLESISQKYLGGRKISSDNFVWTDQALRLADEILWNRSLGIDVMLLGEAGEGKTELPGQIAKLLDLPYYQKTISSETDEEDLVGGIGRINGKIGFIPDLVTLGTEKGGIVHLDEYLLGETGKLEALMNPLMDDTKSLILKNPYRQIPRHSETFFILTSNPPFGEYADRNEHSGAAMSRVAVIYLADDFGMQPKDRMKILKSWAERPIPLGDSGKKKALSPEPYPLPFARGGLGRGRTMHNAQTNVLPPPSPLLAKEGGRKEGLRHSTKPDSQPSTDPVFPLPLHPEIAEKFGIADNLVFDMKTQTILEKKEDGTLEPTRPEMMKAIEKMAAYFTRRTQAEMAPITGRVFKILYALFGLNGANTTLLEYQTILLSITDLFRFPLKAGLGIGKHEWAHATIDRPSEKYDAHEPGRLLANVMGDPRMNEYASSLRADFADQIRVMNEIFWPRVWDVGPINQFLAKLPHEQFADGVIHAWVHGEIMPWILDEKVQTALEKALPLMKPAFTLFPESTADHHVDRAAEEFYKIVDQVWPIYESLIPESIQQLMKLLEQGVSVEELMDPLRISGTGSSSSLSSPPAGEGQGEGEASDTGAMSKKTEDRSQNGEEGNTGDEKKIVGAGILSPKSEEPGEETPTTKMSPSPKPPPVEGGGKNLDTQPFEGEGKTLDPQKIQKEKLDQLEKQAQEILNKRAEKLADRFEPHDPSRFQKRKEQIAQTQAKAQQKQEASLKGETEKIEAQVEPLSQKELQEIQEGEKLALEKATEGDFFRRMVPPKAVQAVKRLKKLMPPTDPAFMEGFFTTGKRMDRKKAAQDAINPMSDGKVMLRRLGLGRHDVNLIMLSDVSGSMESVKQNTIRGTAAAIYLAEELKINYGEIFFSDEAHVGKPLGKPVNTYSKKNDLLHMKQKAFQTGWGGGGTNIRDPLAMAIRWVQERRAKENYILLITDGEETIMRNRKTIPELKQEAEKEGIHLMVLAMGEAKRVVPRLFRSDQFRFVAEDGSDIPDRIVELFAEAHRRRFENSGK